MWFGTLGGGLSRFDGKSFKNYSTKDGLPSNTIYSVFDDGDGNIWIGTQRGIAKFDGRDFRSYLMDGKPLVKAEAFLKDEDGNLVIGTPQGIAIYYPEQDTIVKSKRHPILDKSIVHKLFQGRNGIWAGTNQGAWLITKGTRHLNMGNGLIDNEVLDFEYDKNGILWMTTHGGLSLYDERNKTFLPTDGFPSSRASRTIHRQENGDLWIGLEERGLLIHHAKDSLWSRIGKREGLPNSNITSILKDDRGGVWLSSSGGGVVKYLGRFFVHYDEDDGLPGDRIYALCHSDTTGIIFSASSEGLGRFKNGIETFKPDSGLINVKTKALLEDSKGRLWMGTIGKGLVLRDRYGLRVFNKEKGLPGNEVIDVEEDEQGNIWVGLNHHGIARITLVDSSTYKIKSWDGSHGIRTLRTTALAKAPDGNIWFANRLGEVGYFQGDEIAKIYREENGLTFDIPIRSIAFDTLDQVWVGTAGDGIKKAALVKDSLSFEPFNLNKDLQSYNVYLLIFDKEGELWAGNERGVDHIIINETGVATEVRSYGRNEGFLGIETCRNAAALDPEGNVWFGTMNGLTQHIPSQDNRKSLAPSIHFEEVSLFYRPLRETAYANWASPEGGIKKGLLLPYRSNNISFEFRAVDLSRPDGIQYRWRLEGSETGWSPLSKRQSVDYSNLPPGDYVFEAQAVSRNQFSEPVSAAFTIKKPFWQILWVQILTAFALLGIIGLSLRNWKRNVEKREERKREKLEMENNILQLEQKALQLQMNPHFIFNALNSIQSLVATKDHTSARREINRFAGLMRSILSNSRKRTISLAEEVKTLEQYLGVEQFCQRVDFDFGIEVPNDIDPDEVEIPPMLLQPFIENSVIHGISHLEKDGRIDIIFEVKGDILSCTISDNGVGRIKAKELRQSKNPGHQSVAMQVTEDRLAALAEGKKYRSLEIHDLVDDNGKASGTKVVIRLPFETTF